MTTIVDKRIIVVGASRGLGRGIATELASRGARVLAIGRNEKALAELQRENEQAGLRFAAGDATDPSFVATVVREEDPDAVLSLWVRPRSCAPSMNTAGSRFPTPGTPTLRRVLLASGSRETSRCERGGVSWCSRAARPSQGSPLSGGYAPAKHAQRYPLTGYVIRFFRFFFFFFFYKFQRKNFSVVYWFHYVLLRRPLPFLYG